MLSNKSFYLKLVSVLLMSCSVVVFGQQRKEMTPRQLPNQEMRGKGKQDMRGQPPQQMRSKRPGKGQDAAGIIHPDLSIGLMSSSDIQGTFAAGRQNKQEVKGRLNLDLMTSPELLERGVVQARDVSLVLFGVDYTKIAAKRDNGKDTGVVGFKTDRSRHKDGVSFEYDKKNGMLSANVMGLVDNAVLSAAASERPTDSKGFNDFIQVPQQSAALQLQIKLNEPLPSRSSKSVSSVNGIVSFKVSVRPNRQPQVSGYTFVGEVPFEFQIYPFFMYEVGRDLCIQPVQFLSSASDSNPTGDYYLVGMAGALKEWKKADVTFTIRRFKQVINSAWKVADTSELYWNNSDNLRFSVEDDDCIEIFFVENHDPVDLHGGGAAWGGGTASSQIVTSDGNNNGIDNTHLAHELGHVLDLCHPWGGDFCDDPYMPNASYGTLMCGSGWENDNPQVNSQENKDLVDNPLLKLKIKKLSTGSDCTDSTDCGSC